MLHSCLVPSVNAIVCTSRSSWRRLTEGTAAGHGGDGSEEEKHGGYNTDSVCVTLNPHAPSPRPTPHAVEVGPPTTSNSFTPTPHHTQSYRLDVKSAINSHFQSKRIRRVGVYATSTVHYKSVSTVRSTKRNLRTPRVSPLLACATRPDTRIEMITWKRSLNRRRSSVVFVFVYKIVKTKDKTCPRPAGSFRYMYAGKSCMRTPPVGRRTHSVRLTHTPRYLNTPSALHAPLTRSRIMLHPTSYVSDCQVRHHNNINHVSRLRPPRTCRLPSLERGGGHPRSPR